MTLIMLITLMTLNPSSSSNPTKPPNPIKPVNLNYPSIRIENSARRIRHATLQKNEILSVLAKRMANIDKLSDKHG